MVDAGEADMAAGLLREDIVPNRLAGIKNSCKIVEPLHCFNLFGDVKKFISKAVME